MAELIYDAITAICLIVVGLAAGAAITAIYCIWWLIKGGTKEEEEE